MKNLFLFAIAFLSISFSVNAQNGKVTLCETYDKVTGAPSGIHQNWDIKADGGYVYIVYSQDKKITESLRLYVDKKTKSGTYVAYATEYFNNDTKTDAKKWAMYDFKFTEEGDYKISIMGNGSDALAIAYTNIGFMEGEENNVANKQKAGGYSSDDDDPSDYYMDSKITLGQSVNADGVVSGAATEFKLINGKCDIQAKLEQTEDLNLTAVKVYVYGGKDYTESISSLTYTVASKDWNWIHVPINTTKRGKYVVDMYTDDDVYIQTAYFEVK